MKHGGVAGRATPSRSVTPDSTAPSHTALSLNQAGQAELHSQPKEKGSLGGSAQHVTRGL